MDERILGAVQGLLLSLLKKVDESLEAIKRENETND